jgi:dUTP pyrophosphatase
MDTRAQPRRTNPVGKHHIGAARVLRIVTRSRTPLKRGSFWLYAARMRLKIRRLDPTVPLPTYGTGHAAGFDLAAAHDLTVGPGRIALVRTGLVIEVPPGHFLGIFARSSTPLRRGLIVANGVGIVDPDYSGPTDEVMVQVLNITDRDVHVRRGDRLAQGVVLPAPRVTWDEATELRATPRGGFGSTGT